MLRKLPRDPGCLAVTGLYSTGCPKPALWCEAWVALARAVLRVEQKRSLNWTEISAEVGNAGTGSRETKCSKAQQ